MARIGAQLYTVRETMQNLKDIRKTLKRIAEAGYTAVQLSAHGPVDPGDLARVLEDCNLEVAATHMSWQRFLDDMPGVVADHKTWRCRHAAIGALPPEYRDAEGLDRFLEELPAAAEALASEGIDFSYHNHSHEFVRLGDETWLARLFARAEPALLKAELDTYWIQHGGGDPAHWIRRLAGRQPLLHLKDMTVTVQREQRFAPIGEGNLNWPAVMEAAEQAGVEWYLVELDNCYGEDPVECLARSHRFLRRFGME